MNTLIATLKPYVMKYPFQMMEPLLMSVKVMKNTYMMNTVIATLKPYVTK